MAVALVLTEQVSDLTRNTLTVDVVSPSQTVNLPERLRWQRSFVCTNCANSVYILDGIRLARRQKR